MSSRESQKAGSCEFIAVVRGYEDGRARVEMRSRFHEGDVLEVLSPTLPLGTKVEVQGLAGRDGPCGDAKLVQGEYTFSSEVPLQAGDLLRRWI